MYHKIFFGIRKYQHSLFYYILLQNIYCPLSHMVDLEHGRLVFLQVCIEWLEDPCIVWYESAKFIT